MSIRIRTIAAFLGVLVLLGSKPYRDNVVSAAAPPSKPPDSGGFASISELPTLGGTAEAIAVDAAGTTIAGYSWDRRDLLHAVRWTLAQGAWRISDLPWPPGATSTTARAVSNQGHAAGNDFPGSSSRPVLWPITGGFTLLGCSTDPAPATVYGISADGQVVVGSASGAAVWRPGSCRTALPKLGPDGSSMAGAVNGNGTIVGGTATVSAGSNPLPVRWRLRSGQWQIEQLDGPRGYVGGANTAGDLVGSVYVACSLAEGCQRAAIWYAAGGSSLLGTLGGDVSWAHDINSAGEVVGGSFPSVTSSSGTGFFWSESTGMLRLPFNGQWASARGVSDVRPDNTRVVVGMDSRGKPVVWVVRNL